MTSVAFTTFQNVRARTAVPVKEDWPAFVLRFKNPKEYRDKKAMPLLSLCEYGGKRSAKGSLRHSGNVKAVHGIELDYDGGRVTPEQARKRLQRAGISSVIYTTPSHKPDKPRWRALLPLSKPVSIEERRELVAKANRALGGIVARESFTPSQSFYFGKVRVRKYECVETRGACIDRAKIKPLYPKGNDATGDTRDDATPDDDYIDAFEKGSGRYNAALKLSSRWIAKGIDPERVRAKLHKYVRLAEHDGVKPTTTQGENLYKAINRFVDSAAVKFRGKPTPKDDADFKDIGDLLAAKPEPAEFVIDDWLPIQTVGLYAAHGGRGKSYVALTIAVRIAAGLSVFNRGTKQGTVLYVSAEDDEAELNRRAARILKAQKLERSHVTGKLFIRDATLDDTVLFPASPVRQGERPKITERFKWLRRKIREYKPVLVILDSTVDHFSGNENDRSMVRTFIRKLLTLAQRRRCSILLLAHVDAGTLKIGEFAKGFSGSTAWHNTVRTLWYQYPRDDKDPTGPQVLRLQKTNRAAPGAQVKIEWNTKAIVWDLGNTYRPTGARYARRVFEIVRQILDDGKQVPHATTGGNTAAKAVRDHSDCPTELRAKTKETRRLINEVLAQLVKDRALKIEEHAKAKGTKQTKFYVLGGNADMFEREEDDS